MLSVHHRKEAVETAHERTQRIIYIIRQILNVLFILLGIIGCMMYSGLLGEADNMVLKGAIIAIIAVVMKMGECVLRFINRPN